MAMPIQWPPRSWSDVCGRGLRRVAVSLRGGGGGPTSHRTLPCMASSKKLQSGVGGWTSGV
eukprot:7135419-Pyramimonas_sp.AAC.1